MGTFPYLAKWMGEFKDHPTLCGGSVPSFDLPGAGKPSAVIDLSDDNQPPIKKIKKEKVAHPSTLEPVLQMIFILPLTLTWPGPGLGFHPEIHPDIHPGIQPQRGVPGFHPMPILTWTWTSSS